MALALVAVAMGGPGCHAGAGTLTGAGGEERTIVFNCLI
jgi:hypothetical protein